MTEALVLNNSFTEISNEEMYLIVGGNGEVFNASVATLCIGFTPVLTAICPPVGITVGLVGAYCLYNYYD